MNSDLPPVADQVLILVNPLAGGRSTQDRVDRLAILLGDQRLKVEVFTDLDTVCNLADRWHTDGRLRALVGVGGDGTVAELVNRTVPGVPIALLPAGTANCLAGHLGLTGDPQSVCRVVTAGRIRRLDAGSASGRAFLLMASCGFDAEVVRRLHARRSGHISYWSYLRPILESIRGYAFPEIRVYLDEDRDGSAQEQSPAMVVRWVFAMNLPRYGWGLSLVGEADPADGMLDVCTFRRGKLWHGLRYAAATQLGLHRKMADCTSGRVRRMRIRSEEQVPYQLDGDPGGFLPLDIEVSPGRVTLLVPGE